MLLLLLVPAALVAETVIGVSAFTNLAGEKAVQWLEIGIADSVSHKLRNVRDYIVVERTNVDKIIHEVQLGQTGVLDDKKAKQAGKALGADIIVVGNFQKYGNRIRITAKLVEVESHKILKQVESTGVMDNIFELQDEIALKIIDQTNIKITADVKNRITENFTKNISAYEYYVKGMSNLLYQLNYLEAIKWFDKAIGVDKNYSLAYSGLGKAYSLRRWELKNYENRIDDSLLEKSYQNSRRALDLSPNLDEAHIALARYYQEVDDKKVPNKWKLCEAETRKAIEINPNNAEAYFLLSRIYGYNDAQEEKYLLISIEKNKFLTDAHNNLAVIYLDQKKLDLAEKYFKNTIEIDPEFKTGYMNLGVVYDRKGQLERALEMYQVVLKKYPTYILGLRNLGIGYRRLNRLDEAMAQFRKAVKVKSDDYLERDRLYLPGEKGLPRGDQELSRRAQAQPHLLLHALEPRVLLRRGRRFQECGEVSLRLPQSAPGQGLAGGAPRVDLSQQTQGQCAGEVLVRRGPEARAEQFRIPAELQSTVAHNVRDRPA